MNEVTALKTRWILLISIAIFLIEKWLVTLRLRNIPVPGTIELISSQDQADKLGQLFIGRTNIALGREASQSTTGHGISILPDFDYCGCSGSCRSDILDQSNGFYTCKDRINKRKNQGGITRMEACKIVSEHDNICGDGIACHPEKCPKLEEPIVDFGVAERAVDGNTNPLYGEGSVSLTSLQHNPWWQVDLGDSYRVQQIVLYNRGDCCADQMKNFHVEVLDLRRKRWNVVSHAYSEAEPELFALINFESVVRGRMVRVRIDGWKSLNLAEVLVYGKRSG